MTPRMLPEGKGVALGVAQYTKARAVRKSGDVQVVLILLAGFLNADRAPDCEVAARSGWENPGGGGQRRVGPKDGGDHGVACGGGLSKLRRRVRS